MDELLEIKQPTLVITTNTIKKKLLRELSKNKKILPIKFLTLGEFLSKYFFKVKKEAFLYLKEKENKKLSILEEEVSCFPFLEKKQYESEKLNNLVKLLESLEEQKLLEKDPLFLNSIKKQTVIYYGEELDPFYQKIFKSLPNSKIITLDEEVDKKPVVYKFNDLEEEISYVGGEIIKKIQSGTSIESLKLLNLTEEYKNPIRRIFALLNIPIELGDKTRLSETVIGQKALNYLDEKESLSDVLTSLKEEYPNESIIDSITSVFNEYYWYTGSLKNIKEFISEDFKKKTVSRPKKKNCIECTSFDEIEDDNFYFLLGFNKENLPRVYKDEAFLTDKEKKELGLFTSEEKNKLEKKKIKSLLSKIPNLTITFKEKSAFSSWNPSLLIEEMQLEVIESKSTYQQSNLYNQVLLSRYLDKLNKYGIIEKTLPTLYSTYYYLPYMTFDNQFKGINPENLKEYLNNKLLLSYSSIDNFYKCQFRYYLSNILKIDKFESTFFTTVGTIFHNVLEKCLENDFDFDTCFNQELSNYTFKNSELVLLTKLKEELLFDISTLKKQKQYTSFNKELHEEKFYLSVSDKDNLKTTFMGIVDKILYLEENNKTYLSIIDYKTGHLPDNLNNVVYGIGMQLPIYLYLVNHSKKFSSPKVVGIFLQKIINKELKRQIGKEYLAEKANNLKLVGYCLDEEDSLEKFDETYEDSALIKSLKKGKNGFYKYSRVLNEEKMNRLEEIVSRKIEEADEKIRKADFEINPKRIGKDIVGCEFCRYKDICFRKEENIVSLKEYKNLDFLGGEEDA